MVDVTNYVMLEFNQPLHAFDLATVTDRHVVVRRASPGEKFTTLDGVERTLTNDTLMIADPAQAIGIGGVMGGANSEITAATTTMLLESATFHNLNNRRTATNLNLRTEASLRFEKGLRAELAPIALRRATQLILQTAAARLRPASSTCIPMANRMPRCPCRNAGCVRCWAWILTSPAPKPCWPAWAITTRRTGPDSLEADAPYWRSDIAIEEDLIEEVVRIIGYDEVPTTMLSSPIPYHRPNPLTELKEAMRDALSTAGMEETISYPLISAEDLTRLDLAEDEQTPWLRVANPMSAEYNILRPEMIPSLLNTLAYNQAHNDGGFRLFEIGRSFGYQDGNLPHEREWLAGVMSGPRFGDNWLTPADLMDFYDASGVVSTVLGRVGFTASLQEAVGARWHPGRAATISVRAATGAAAEVGVVGEMHPDINDRFGLRPRARNLLPDCLRRSFVGATRHRGGGDPFPVAVPFPRGQPRSGAAGSVRCTGRPDSATDPAGTAGGTHRTVRRVHRRERA